MAALVTSVDIQLTEVKEREGVQEKPRTCRSGDAYYAPYGNSLDAERDSSLSRNVNRTRKVPGPDWSSRLRYLPPPQHDVPPSGSLFAAKWSEKRHFPRKARRCADEWDLSPESDRGPRTTWNGLHPANMSTHDEITHTMLFGKKHSASDAVRMRNGIRVASLGDKPYQVPEYSADFHKVGSTLPLANFGNRPKSRADTFVPLVKMPEKPRESYTLKERRRIVEVAMDEVARLNKWRPATPLSSGQQLRLPKNDSFDELSLLPALTT